AANKEDTRRVVIQYVSGLKASWTPTSTTAAVRPAPMVSGETAVTRSPMAKPKSTPTAISGAAALTCDVSHTAVAASKPPTTTGSRCGRRAATAAAASPATAATMPARCSRWRSAPATTGSDAATASPTPAGIDTTGGASVRTATGAG